MTDKRDNTSCYIARAKVATEHYSAGAVVCAIVDDGVMDCSKDVGKWLRDGLIIERAPVWWVRLHLFSTEPLPKFES